MLARHGKKVVLISHPRLWHSASRAPVGPRPHFLPSKTLSPPRGASQEVPAPPPCYPAALLIHACVETPQPMLCFPAASTYIGAAAVASPTLPYKLQRVPGICLRLLGRPADAAHSDPTILSTRHLDNCQGLAHLPYICFRGDLTKIRVDKTVDFQPPRW